MTARGGAFLDHLLVLPLDGTFALPQRDDIPLPVAEELHLNMFRGGDKLFQINAAVPKSKLGFLRSGAECVLKILRTVYAANPSAAAARARLHQKRIPDPVRLFVGFGQILYHLASRDNRHARCNHGLACSVLVAHLGDHLGGRPNKDDVALLT